MASNKDAYDDLSTFLEEDKGQEEPSHPPTQIEDYDDICTYVVVEAANGAPLLIPSSKDIIIIMDNDHSDDVSVHVFSDPNNGLPAQLPPTLLEDQEYTFYELFGIEEADPDHDPRFENDNAITCEVLNDGEERAITLGLEYLFAKDAALGALITEHAISAPVYDTQKMTSFQRVTRPLLELISIPQRKTTIYEALENLCRPDVVRPYSVRTTSYQQLINIGVASISEAMLILHLGKKFAEAGGDNMNTILSDDLLNDLSDHEFFHRLQGVSGLKAYMAFNIMLFGFNRLNFWPTEKEFEVKYDAFNQRLQRWSWSDEAVGASESWEPYKGLAAWIIWTHA